MDFGLSWVGLGWFDVISMALVLVFIWRGVGGGLKSTGYNSGMGGGK